MKYISLTQDKFAIIDDSDFEWLSQWKWCFDKKGYAVRWQWLKKEKRYIFILMHRLILNTPDNLETDHRNGNGLDNQRNNLRICTRQQNLQNRRKILGTTSKYKGVYWNKNNQKWMVRVKKIYTGYFDSEK